MRTEIAQLNEVSGACGVAAAELGPTARAYSWTSWGCKAGVRREALGWVSCR